MAERVYTVVFDNVAVTAAQDFFEITPADDKPVRLLGIFLSQSSDVGDAAEEILRYSIVRGHATSGSGGTAPTPRPLDRSGAAAGCTAEVNNTTIASAGTGVTLHHDCFNVRSGLQLWFPPECCHEASQGDTTIVVRLLSTPADSLTMSGTLYLAEGG
jgi:hypothetical protein